MCAEPGSAAKSTLERVAQSSCLSRSDSSHTHTPPPGSHSVQGSPDERDEAVGRARTVHRQLVSDTY